MTKTAKITLLLSLVFIGLIRFQPVWVRTPGGLWHVLFFILTAGLFFWIAIKLLLEIGKIVDNRKALTIHSFVPIGILALALADGMYNPLNINLEKLYGEVLFRACYEGTQNQATFKLREGGKFEIHATGVFFSNDFYTGTYDMRADTIFLHFDTGKPRTIGDTLLIQDDKLFVIESDTLKPSFFYLGYCKGLN